MMHALQVMGWWSESLISSAPPQGRAVLGMGRRAVLLVATMLATVLLAGGVTLALTPTDAPSGTDRGMLRDAQGRDAALDGALEELVEDAAVLLGLSP